MISLMFSVVSRIWEITTTEQKENLDPSEVQSIDNFIQEFKNNTTWADRLYAQEGGELVQRLLNRQQQIGDILS